MRDDLKSIITFRFSDAFYDSICFAISISKSDLHRNTKGMLVFVPGDGARETHGVFAQNVKVIRDSFGSERANPLSGRLEQYVGDVDFQSILRILPVTFTIMCMTGKLSHNELSICCTLFKDSVLPAMEQKGLLTSGEVKLNQLAVDELPGAALDLGKTPELPAAVTHRRITVELNF